MKAFVSYSQDNNAHKDWVRNFVNRLRNNGVDAKVDQYDLRLGDDLFEFMENSIKQADVVLPVCTPQYVRKANKRKKGVGIETRLITPKFFDDYPGKPIIPILRKKGPRTPHTPDYMAGIYFADFRDDSMFNSKLEDLLRHLHNDPLFVEPPIGPAPKFGLGNGVWGMADIRRSTIDSERRIFVSHPFASLHRVKITDSANSISRDLGLLLSFSHMPTEEDNSRCQIIENIDRSHGLIAVWDDSDEAHALFRPWRTFEFTAAQASKIPTVLFCHERFRKLVGRESQHIVFYSVPELVPKLKESFDKIQQLIEETKHEI